MDLSQPSIGGTKISTPENNREHTHIYIYIYM